MLGQAVGESLQLPYINLSVSSPTKKEVLAIPETLAKEFRFVAFHIEPKKNLVKVATDSPKKKGLTYALQSAFPNMKIILYYALPADIDSAFVFYRRALTTSFAKILENNRRFAPEIITVIIEDAVLYRASYIHFEPQEEETIIRFRVDGVLQEAGRIQKEYYSNVVNRLKVQAHLRIDEHSRAQDGAIRMEVSNGQHVDLRLSLVPTLDGEKIVIRVLSEYVLEFTLAELGLSTAASRAVQSAIEKPFGMVLVVGPTGSGKTTTLYTLLRMLNNPEVNLTTIEDPVEYKIKGINQIQVNNATNLTFAAGLRSIVRQDPDVILVGEIRDEETAEIAVNAALTGHMMLSTFHANDSATAIPRLIEMGVEPFLLASTLEILVAQRLIRKLCEVCRVSNKKSAKELNALLTKGAQVKLPALTVYEGKGCDNCNGSGYKGRIAVYEFIEVSSELEQLILEEPSASQIWNLALKQGATTLFSDGIEKVKQGVTTIEEVLRVAPPK